MITSFFKPKSQKVQPVVANGPTNVAAVNDNTKKRNYIADDDINPRKRIKSTTHEDSEVVELLSYLNAPKGGSDNDDALATWKDAMAKHFASPSFARLAKFVAAQRKSHTIFPPAPDTFSALNWTPLDQVKVVIVGQDPYHGPSQAHGLSFSVRKGIRTPPSLRNIYKELMQDTEISNFTRLPAHGYLERWAEQGVLMINAVLTVKQADANSHKNRGWEAVTDEMIRAVDRRAKAQKRGVVFLLWGKPATLKAETALGGTNKARHHIICTSHPSPLGATKTKSPFMGSKCFSRANEALKDFGYDEIDWKVDGVL